jgi:hypothetical protein
MRRTFYEAQFPLACHLPPRRVVDRVATEKLWRLCFRLSCQYSLKRVNSSINTRILMDFGGEHHDNSTSLLRNSFVLLGGKHGKGLLQEFRFSSYLELC